MDAKAALVGDVFTVHSVQKVAMTRPFTRRENEQRRALNKEKTMEFEQILQGIMEGAETGRIR